MGISMAIKTVTNDNLSEYVAERQARGSQIQTGNEAVAQADASPKSEGVATPGNPIISKGEAETLGTIPEPSGGEPTAKAQADKAKAGTDPGVQKRIDQLTREKKEVEEAFEAEYIARIEADRKLRELEAGRKAEEKVEEVKRPRLADFKTAEEFDKAMDVYETSSRKTIEQNARNAAQAQAAADRANEQLAQRYSKAREDIGDDFDSVIQEGNRAGIKPSEPIQAALRETEYGVHVAYYLLKHPDEMKRLEALTPVRQVAEIGKLEMQFIKVPAKTNGAEPEPKPQVTTTKAPAPISAIRAETGAITQDLSSPMNFADYKAQRLTQIRQKRRG